MAQRRKGTAQQRKVDSLLNLMRMGIAPDELDDHDWESLRVAARLVCETERLGDAVGRRAIADRSGKVEDWSDSLEGAITYMSWLREFAHVVTGMKYSKSAPVGVGRLWQRHGVLAARLFGPQLAPADRLALLVQLGAIEIALWGHTWALEPMRLRHPERAIARHLRAIEPSKKKRAAIMKAIRRADASPTRGPS